MNRALHAAGLVLLSLALACARARSTSPSAEDDGAARAFAAPDQLNATLVGTSEIALAWRHRAAEPGGYWVEFATPGSDFVKLDVAWSEQPALVHAELAPSTTFLYRVVPFFGRASPAVTVVSGAATPDEPLQAEGPLEEPAALDSLPRRSLKGPATMDEATPAGVTVTLPAPTTATVRWTDRATDEDGYLVELARGHGAFQICALLPPGTTSFRKVALPPSSELRFRVRAFFLGAPSNLVAATTPPQSP